MQKKILFIGFVLMMTSTLQLKAQYTKTDSTYKRWFVGSTIFLLGNLATTNPHTKMPDGFKQLDDKWSKFIFGEPGLHFGFNF